MKSSLRLAYDRRVLAIALLVSLLSHLLFGEGLKALPRTIEPAPAPPPELLVEVSAITETPPPAPEPEPEPAPAPEPEPEPEVVVPPPKAPPKPRAVRRERPPPEPQPAEPPAPAQENIADFSGLVLTGKGNSGFTTAQGDGNDREGPIGRPGGVTTGRNRAGVEGGVVGGTGDAIVAVADLSSRPSPPSAAYDSYLAKNYPAEARSRGVSGSAVLSLIIGSDGKPRSIRVRRERPEGFGFGEVCAAMFRTGPAWSPPRDSDGNAVATRISFECEFSLRR